VLRAAKEQRALPVPVGKSAPTLEQVIAGAALAGPVDARGAR